jgi:pseudaminic acid synthase
MSFAQAQRGPTEQRLSGPVLARGVSIAGREISAAHPPYIVAELSCNHGGSIGVAKRLILAAKLAGADAVKLQTYTPAELTTPAHQDLWSLYEKAQTPREWHQELFQYAYEQGITIFSSAFSVDGVKFLQGLGAPAIKIASAEATDNDLVLAANETGLPVIVSMGMLDMPLVLADISLHCVAQYPSRIEDANLRVIADWPWGDNIGLSDHTPGYETAIAATALGAVMIEKHFKLDDDCIDAAYSLNPTDFAAMCKAVRAIWHGMGDGVMRPTGRARQR